MIIAFPGCNVILRFSSSTGTWFPEWDYPDQREVCQDEVDARNERGNEKRTLYELAESTCRNLKLAYQRLGDYQRAGMFFFGEMECNRLSRHWTSARRLFLTLLKTSCGYGEYPTRVFALAFSLIMYCTITYAFFGAGDEGKGFWMPWKELYSLVVSDPARYYGILWKGFYLSCITFSTVGYGDVHPSNIVAQSAAVVEALGGAFLMALFMIVVSRKFTR